MKQFWPRALLLLAALIATFPVAALADQDSQPGVPAAGQITAGDEHSCAVLTGGARCWGFGANRRLGNGTTDSIGDDETPGSVGPIDFGAHTATAISAGAGHTCALLDDRTVRCWGFGANGRLGTGGTADSPAGQSPGDAPAVDLGGPAQAISAGDSHTCALLVDGTVRCWGYGAAGQLGYSKPNPSEPLDPSNPATLPPDVGDDETPGSAGPVNLGAGVTATAISAGGSHTCALLSSGAVRCWGYGFYGQLGLGLGAGTQNVGDNETPNTVSPVYLGVDGTGAALTATAISAGNAHTCALLRDASVRCWGYGFHGQLGLGNTNNVGVAERPGDVAPVAFGAKAISAGGEHTCALLEDGSLRCWGRNQLGQLGYGNTSDIGDNELPGAVGTVDLGPGRTARAVGTGTFHTCALLDDASVRCWGFGAAGRLGYCNQASIGDNELPGAVGPIDFGAAGDGCRVVGVVSVPGGPSPPPADRGTPAAQGDTPVAAAPIDPRDVETARGRALRACLRTAARRAKAARTRARRACLTRYGRTPGPITRLRAHATSSTRVVLTFTAPGSDGSREPAARAYLVRQSLHPLRSARDIARAPALCHGSCRLAPRAVGATITLTITGLRPATTYSYSVAARDNVSRRLGPRSATVRVRTRQAAAG